MIDIEKKLSPLQKFVFYRTYSRWNDDLERRETWTETVDRYFNFFKGRFEEQVPKKVWEKARANVLSMNVAPSMRALWTAGPALEKCNVVGYNCCYLAIKDLNSVPELFYVLMCGTGVGFSVEKQFISRIQSVAHQTSFGNGVFVVQDSKEGWADALKAGLNSWFNGRDIEFDYSFVRPRGSRLKTMGGRASGPEPLKELLSFVRSVVLNAQNRQLTSLEWMDICNKVAEVVVVGGVRRSSEISFSDLSDESIRDAKDFSKGPFPLHRYMSNNTAVYNGRPDIVTFLKEWTALAGSGSGERGIFNTETSLLGAPRRVDVGHFRTNPCGEINLRDSEFCNLSEVIVRKTDTFADLCEKVKSAVWLGAMQSCLTDFPYLRKDFQKNCEEERLLGVSLTGQMDAPKLMTEDRLADLKAVAIAECKKASKTLGIPMSAAITTGKPSGTVSQLVDCSSGAHPRFAKFYIRRVRIGADDPLCKLLKASGVPLSPENGQGPESRLKAIEDINKSRRASGMAEMDEAEASILVPAWNESTVNTWVVSFPERAPTGAITKDDMSAIDQLEWYKKLRTNWCEHNQSITVYVRDSEWLDVGNWVYKNFDTVSGVSFLPFDGGHYEQAPYEEITEKQFETLKKSFPEIDYARLSEFEKEDNTTGAKALACVGGACEIV